MLMNKVQSGRAAARAQAASGSRAVRGVAAPRPSFQSRPDSVVAHAGLFDWLLGKKEEEKKVEQPAAVAAAPAAAAVAVAEPPASNGVASAVKVDIGGHTGKEADAPADEKTIAALFDKWNAALATKNPEIVADCYAPDGVLLPTVSNQVRTTRAEIVDYFTSFTKLSPQGVIDQGYVRLLNNELAMHSGVYTFTLQPQPNQSKKVQARFTFMYKKVNGQWLIAEHHSSAMPEKTAEAEIAEQFDRWNSALQTGNPEQVAALYAPDGVLLPTVSNMVRTKKAAIVDYFTNFLKLKPFGTIDESVVRQLDDEHGINSGVYTFRLVKDGKEQRVQARYTFIYKKIDGQWYIAEHHSSAMPEAGPAKVGQRVLDPVAAM